MSFGDRVKRARMNAGFTQEELAKKLGYKDKSSVARIEAESADITRSKLIEISEVLNVSLEYLMEWDENNSHDNLVDEGKFLLDALPTMTPEKQKKLKQLYDLIKDE